MPKPQGLFRLSVILLELALLLRISVKCHQLWEIHNRH